MKLNYKYCESQLSFIGNDIEIKKANVSDQAVMHSVRLTK